MTASPRGVICRLDASILEAVHAQLAAGAASPKVVAWLHETHGITIRYPVINAHLRAGHAGDAAGPRGKVAAASQPTPRPPKAAPQDSAAKGAPPAPPGDGTPASAPTSTDPAAPQPHRKHPVVDYIDHFVSELRDGALDVNDAIRQRINAVAATVTDTPGLENAMVEGRSRLPPTGPTDAEARYITGVVAGVNALLKTRTLYTGGAGGAKASELDAMVGGLKQKMVDLGLPPPPPALDGDDADPADDDAIKGYDAASPEPPPPPDDAAAGSGGKGAPTPPPSGPRTPIPVTNAPAAVRLKAVGGISASWKTTTNGPTE